MNARTDMKVDFVICGTQKGGTAALDMYLRAHPEICMANKKEVHFFDKEEFFRDGAPDYANYHAFFSPGSQHKVLGEATPIYMYWRDAARRIWEYSPTMKLIVLLRNPVDRAFSHWNMERVENRDSASFWDAIHSEAKRSRKALPYQHRVYSYIDRGFYLEQLRRLWAFFPKQQMLVLKTEELQQHPNDTLQRIFAFLGVTPLPLINPVNVHGFPHTSHMSQEERDYLRSIFEYEIKALERTLGWDCSHWLAKGSPA
ncbi:MAG: sulfotransferase domain-containing protein [Gammaproteobacteria bacterium]|nr:sulfotransferase domain-containing protein [Gammaproteobacteria bacterium]